MKLHVEQGDGTHRIRSCTADAIVIGQTTYSCSLIVAPDEIIADWPPRTLDELTADHLSRIVELRPELVLLGTGHTLRFPGRAVLRGFIERGISHEVMNTGAACRTYNVLAAEGRRVVAGLLVER